MSLERSCPYCGKPFTVTYIELCALPLGRGYRRWYGRCLHCNCNLQASTCWEMLTMAMAFLVTVAVVLLILPHHKPSGLVFAAYVLLSVLILYFVNGLVRYLTISRAVLS